MLWLPVGRMLHRRVWVVVGFPLLCLMYWKVRLKMNLEFCIALCSTLGTPLWGVLGFLVCLNLLTWNVRLKTNLRLCIALFWTSGVLMFVSCPFRPPVRLVAVRWVCVTQFSTVGLLARRHSDQRGWATAVRSPNPPLGRRFTP